MQKEMFSKVHAALENNIARITGADAMQDIRTIFLLQCILQSANKLGFISESLSNNLIQEQYNSLKAGKNFSFRFPENTINKNKLQDIISSLKAQDIIKETEEDTIKDLIASFEEDVLNFPQHNYQNDKQNTRSNITQSPMGEKKQGLLSPFLQKHLSSIKFSENLEKGEWELFIKLKISK